MMKTKGKSTHKVIYSQRVLELFLTILLFPKWNLKKTMAFSFDWNSSLFQKAKLSQPAKACWHFLFDDYNHIILFSSPAQEKKSLVNELELRTWKAKLNAAERKSIKYLSCTITKKRTFLNAKSCNNDGIRAMQVWIESNYHIVVYY